MPVSVKKRGKKFRVVEPGGKISKTPNGNPRDGGGHATRLKASAQVRAINTGAKSKKRG